MLDRVVAIKTINLAADRGGARRVPEALPTEAKAAGGLNHPNIVTIFDFGERDDIVYMAMEFLEGTDLRKRVLAEPLPSSRRPWRSARRWPRDSPTRTARRRPSRHQAGQHHGLPDGRGEDHGLRHRAHALVRPQDPDRHAARLAEVHVARADAPASAVDQRSDIFSLGIVIYEMLTGARCSPATEMTADDAPASSTRRAGADARQSAAAADARLRRRAGAREGPGVRYQDADEIAADLRACVAELAAAAPPRADEDDGTQTLPIGSFALPDADTEETINLAPPPKVQPQPERRDLGPRLAISRRFDSTEAMRRLATVGGGEAIERTVRLDRAALAAASVPPRWRRSALPPSRAPRGAAGCFGRVLPLPRSPRSRSRSGKTRRRCSRYPSAIATAASAAMVTPAQSSQPRRAGRGSAAGSARAAARSRPRAPRGRGGRSARSPRRRLPSPGGASPRSNRTGARSRGAVPGRAARAAAAPSAAARG